MFADDAERQGAYDFLESPHVEADALEEGVGRTVAARCATEKRILVAVDGSSLSFVDREGTRGLGAIGSYAAGGLGLKVISTLALSTDGVPLGLLRQVFWRRPVHRPTNRRPSSERPIDKKETKHWLDAVVTSAERISSASGAPGITFLVDREGDSAAMLSTLVSTGQNFIVRGNWDRTVASSEDGRPWKLRDLIAYQKVLGSYEIELPAAPGRAARTATISLRVANIVLPLKEPVTGRKIGIELAVVNAREMVGLPAGEERLDWLLLTNANITTFKQAQAVASNYRFRWRIEEFHRAWKSECNVEQSQLRSEQALRKWAIVLAAVASRVERLKLLARESPQLPADAEFSEIELHALVLLKRRSKKKTETIPNTVPTIEQATLR